MNFALASPATGWKRPESRRPRAVHRLLESAIVAAIFVAGLVTGTRYVSVEQLNPYGDFLASAAMVACGRGFVSPAAATPALLSFASRARPSVSCAEVAGDQPPRGPGAFAENHRNLIYSVAAAMSLGGVSWATLDAFAGGLFGLSMALIYGLLRLTVGPLPALAGVAILLYSDQIFQLANLRDFAKEPWFVGAWLALGWLLGRTRAGASPALYLPAAVGGAVVGVGIGFRVDLMACLPVFPAAILVLVAGWERPALRIKGTAIAVFLVAFGVTAMPTLATLKSGSNSGHVAVMGLTSSFTSALGLEPPLYDIGDIYSDGFAHALIAAHAVVVQRDPLQAGLGTAEYDRQGFALLIDNAVNFPADQLVRMFGATAQAIRHPFTERSRRAYLASGLLSRSEPYRTLASWRDWALSWFDGFALLIAGFALCAIVVRDWRLGVAVTLLGLYFCGYSMIQYSRRHTFHFDVIPVNLLLIAIQAAYAVAVLTVVRARAGARSGDRLPVFRQPAIVRVFGFGALAGLLVLALVAARLWQQQHVSTALERTLDLRWHPLATEREALDIFRDGVIETTWADLHRVHPERWGRPLALVRVRLPDSAPVTNPDAAIRWAYLRMEIGGEHCRAGAVSVGLKYSGPVPTFDWEYTRAFEVPVDGSARQTVLLVPVFYWAASSEFNGFVVPLDQVPCIGAVSRADAGADVAFPLLATVLPPAWRSLALYQRMAR